MRFALPLWLFGLIPWAGVTIWLLLARSRQVPVPFIPFWQHAPHTPRAKPSIARPPLPVLLTILGLLLAVLAAARPTIPSRTGPPITIIVDRGITMSARGERIERFKETANAFAPPLLSAIGDGPVDLTAVPGGQAVESDRASWPSAVAAMPPVYQTSQPELGAVLRRALSDPDRRVIVISDQPVSADPRVIEIQPNHDVSNLTVAAVAARATPHAQVMVELRDQRSPAEFRQATIHVDSASNSVAQILEMPRNGTATAFLDLPSLGATVSVHVDGADDLASDNDAWLAREHTPVNIEAPPGLPEPLRRMIAVYQHHRQTGGKNVLIATGLADLPADVPTILLAPDSLAPQSGPLRVEPQPLTDNIDWPSITAGAAGGNAPGGYHVLVSKGSASLLALRDGINPSIWVCLNSLGFPTQPDYVIFWTNVFDYLAGDDTYRWHPANATNPPGLSIAPDGRVQAYNAINVDFPAIHPTDLSRLGNFDRRIAGGIELAPELCLAAIVLIGAALFAAAVGKRAPLPLAP